MVRPDDDFVWITLSSLAVVGAVAVVAVFTAKCCKQLACRSGRQRDRLLYENTDSITSSSDLHHRLHELKQRVPDNEVNSLKRTGLIHKAIRKENLLLMKKLGDGRYGAIYEAELYGLVEHEAVRKVIAKLLQNDQSDSIKEFQNDIEKLSKLNHKHVVGLLAKLTSEVPKCYVVDCGQMINLLEYVRNLKSKSSIHKELLAESQEPDLDETEDETIIENAVSVYEELLMDLFTFADHIALGMAYLSSLSHVHKDLALRNCIIDYDSLVKVTIDNELAKSKYPEAYSSGSPVRWMSPESLLNNVFTTHSDVWSYGIVFWELITLGEVPYSRMSDDALVLSALTASSDYQLPQRPILCSENTFAVMKKCWSTQPTSRPSFTQLHEQIYKLTITG